MFAEEKPALLPASPGKPFRYYQHGKRRRGNLDGLRRSRRRLLRPAPRVGSDEKVNVQWIALCAHFSSQERTLLREHVRQKLAGIA